MPQSGSSSRIPGFPDWGTRPAWPRSSNVWLVAGPRLDDWMVTGEWSKGPQQPKLAMLQSREASHAQLSVRPAPPGSLRPSKAKTNRSTFLRPRSNVSRQHVRRSARPRSTRASILYRSMRDAPYSDSHAVSSQSPNHKRQTRPVRDSPPHVTAVTGSPCCRRHE